MAITAPRDLDDTYSPNPPDHLPAATSGFITITDDDGWRVRTHKALMALL